MYYVCRAEGKEATKGQTAYPEDKLLCWPRRCTADKHRLCDRGRSGRARAGSWSYLNTCHPKRSPRPETGLKVSRPASAGIISKSQTKIKTISSGPSTHVCMYEA